MLTVCPVLYLTPRVRYALQWFDLTHEIASNGFGLWYRQACLPRPGGVGDQPYWLLQAFRVIASELTAVLHRRATKPTPPEPDEPEIDG
jgi:hypothetical protein